MKSLQQVLTQDGQSITRSVEVSKPPARKCPHCGTHLEPKRFEMFGQVRWGSVTCPCETKAREALEAEKKRRDWLTLCQEFTSRDKLIPRATLGNYSRRPGRENALKIAQNFADTYSEWQKERPGLGIYINGTNGLGKTHLLTGIYRDLIGQRASAVFMTTYHMFQRFREVAKVEDYEYERRLLKVLYTCDVLLLDDVGGEVPYDSRAEKLLDVINARSKKRPIIYSSNLTPEGLEHWMGNQGTRIADRIFENSVTVTLNGESERGLINDRHHDWLAGRVKGLG
ncbi:cell division protein ZapE [Brevibacillus nitrificans]|uniref:Cell division protein ZapE n=1 Tax=Brevibacillus nitrificans TaxID=651560 RepID=A0A3M8DRV0_9BACL|nr:ATP-binding protein [Brevibacillus nitrificans]RNB90185.1 cell division protein ZapE [Brevibacillus nitrificans]